MTNYLLYNIYYMSKLLDLINKYEESNNIKSIHEQPAFENMLNIKKQQQLTDLIQNKNGDGDKKLNLVEESLTKKLKNKNIQADNKAKIKSKSSASKLFTLKK